MRWRELGIVVSWHHPTVEMLISLEMYFHLLDFPRHLSLVDYDGSGST